ncbi:MAG: AAA family ATPase [Candidatus Limnocylindria bacterium]
MAERRLVSVLFADLVGFTTLAEDRDPEETRELLSRYFEVARGVIGRYGGTVEKFIGDAVMAVWGTPAAHEDDAERAVRAALELVDAVEGLGTDVAGTLSVRAGVLTGEAAVSLGAEGQGMVAGDLVNTASRLQSVAPAGSVLVGEATYRAATDAVAFEPVGEQQLKGKQLPIRAWQALRVVAQRGGAGRADAVEPPFTGREEELRLLKEFLHATTREQRPRLVSITGTAGIGKSRLAWELLKYVDGLVEDVYWHEGRSPAYGDGVTFWSLGEMVRRRAGIAETDDDDVSREKLRATVADYVTDDAERRTIEPRLAGLLGLEEMPSGEREQLFSAWRTFFERIADRGTTVLVFEDLHWADDGLLDFIEHLLEWARSKAILVITLARPELLDRRPTWGTRQRSFTAVHLDPLDGGAMRSLVLGMVPGVPGRLVERIMERAEGVPLYAVELVRMLLADGRLVADGGRFRAQGEIERIEVPASLQGLLTARLDAIDAADRAMLQTAAVLGQSFTADALVAVSGADIDLVQATLGRLMRGELISLDVDPRSPERGQYRFLQGLTREVAYGMLARAERRTGHTAAARYYEQLGEEELASVLASHYLEAHRAAQAGPEADALAAQARIALRAAADRAAALHSHRQALGLLRSALEIATDGLERTQLWERAAEAADAAAELDVGAEYAEHALDWYRSAGDDVAAAVALHRLGRILIHSGTPDRGLDLLEQAVADHPEAAERPEWAGILAELARAHLVAGSGRATAPRVLELSERALILAERHDQNQVVTGALITRGTALGLVGRPREGTALLKAAAELAGSEGWAFTRLRALGNLSFVQIRDDPHVARLAAEAGLAEAERLGLPGWISFLAGNAAEGAFITGDWDRIEELVETVARSAGAHHGAALGVSATVASFRGDSDRARRLMEEALNLVEGVTEPQILQSRALMRSQILLAGGSPAEAADVALNAAELSDSSAYDVVLHAARAALWIPDATRHAAAATASGTIEDHGRFIDGLRTEIAAGEHAFAGRRGEAAGGFRDAARRWREFDLPLNLAFALMGFAAAAGDEPEVAGARAEARASLQRIGADPFADLLDAWLPDVSRAIPQLGTAASPHSEAQPASARPR